MFNKIENEIKNFYNYNLQSFGSTAQGVGWKNQEAQQVRFEQLSKILIHRSHFLVNDLGCGIADFANYLFNNGYADFNYSGYDVLEEMIKISTDQYREKKNCIFKQITSAEDMELADYTIASGIFNLRYAISDEQWLNYILQTIVQMDKNSCKGFAFNALTSYSDKEKMQEYLYYADPLYLFDYCKKNFSRNVALLHDYNQYDFTILVRKI